jgi:leucyl aminopeptidase
MKIKFSKIDNTATAEATVLLIKHNLVLSDYQSTIDKKHHGLIKTTLKANECFKKFGHAKTLTTQEGDKLQYIILFSLGEDKELTNNKLTELGGKIVSKLAMLKIKDAVIHLDYNHSTSKAQIATLMAEGASLSAYRFDKYFTKKPDNEKFPVQNLTIELEDAKTAEKLFESKKALLEGVFLARDCVSEPANKLYPASYAEIIERELEASDVTVEIFGEAEMKNMGMGALLGVGQGSINESKLVVMQYNGASDDVQPVAFVGKGVTFDTGGISLKPSAGMADMKYDMAGSAAVVGVMKALAARKAKVNAVGVVGLVENMPGGNAQRPGDIVTTMSGQTIEVLDTDAEGRLVLADALWYTQDRFKPKFIIDLATLTGAIVVALGNTFAGCFSNNDELAEQISKAGFEVDEKVWRMPLHQDYDDMMKSDVADVANLSNVRGAAGSGSAANFLQRFIGDNNCWAHLDIAGMAWERKGAAITPKGATGYGVRLLNQLIQDYYETN